MPRTRRIAALDAALHVICRGNNRQNVFYNDNDKLRYYNLLRELKYENKISILHYCLMDNHIHAILLLDSGSRVLYCSLLTNKVF